MLTSQPFPLSEGQQLTEERSKAGRLEKGVHESKSGGKLDGKSGLTTTGLKHPNINH